MKKLKFLLFLLAITAIALNLTSCAPPPPPKRSNNICSVFKQYPDWYWTTKQVQKRWHVPISTQMAIIKQESHFTADAKPPRTKLLWVIPWLRPTSAYGYSQAIDSTWKRYKNESGGMFSSRDAFADAADFIGWYGNKARKKAGVSPSNAYALYLAYHEGIGGYRRGTYKRKKWLIKVAKKVNNNAHRYHRQLKACASRLPTEPWWHVW